jgi:hypothetical protein
VPVTVVSVSLTGLTVGAGGGVVSALVMTVPGSLAVGETLPAASVCLTVAV